MALQERRRYKWLDGRLQKRNDGENADGWVPTKAEAYAAVDRDEFGEPVEKRGPGRPPKEDTDA